MNRTVWKYPVPIADFTLNLPEGSEIVHVESQQGDSQLWAIVDLDIGELVARNFYVTGTGHDVPDDAAYLRSWTQGPFVWHLWEKI